MTVYGCTISFKAEVLPELKLMGHRYKKKKMATHINTNQIKSNQALNSATVEAHYWN
jgi:hypothetical protein